MSISQEDKLEFMAALLYVDDATVPMKYYRKRIAGELP